MKRFTYLMLASVLLMSTTMNAQDTQECRVKYQLFKSAVGTKNYDGAYNDWIWVMDNCPTLSVNVYKLGIDIAKDKYAKDKVEGAKLVRRVYEQRIEHFSAPKYAPAKAYNDLAKFLVEDGGTDQEINDLLQKAFELDPTALSSQNLYRYFDGVMVKYQDTDVQKVLDTYDDVIDGLDQKTAKYQGKMNALLAKEEAGTKLTAKEEKSKRIATQVLKNNGILAGGLEAKVNKLLNCDRLIPLYKRDYEANKSNGQWLKRAVSKMYHKDCTNDPLYETLVKSFAEAEPSEVSYMFLAQVLRKNGKVSEADAAEVKAESYITDPIKLSNLKYKKAFGIYKTGKYSQARSMAYEALKLNPSNGKAYVLIGTMYQKSANNCGTDELSKRMVYVAAVAKLNKAKQVDPSISSQANKLIKSYKGQYPSKQLLFTKGVKSGDPHKVGCWIGETVRIP